MNNALASNLLVTRSRPHLSDQEFLNTICRLHREHGGSTVNRHKGDMNGLGYYAVSPYPGRTYRVPGQNINAVHVMTFLLRNRDLLADPQHSLGTWYSEELGETMVDVVVTVESQDLALRIGMEAHQIAIWNLATCEEVAVLKR